MHLTSPYETIYSFSLCGWFNSATGKGEIGLNSFELIRNAVAVCGTHALDQIVQVEIFNSIGETSQYLNKILQNMLRDAMDHLRDLILSKNKTWMSEMEKMLASLAKSHLVKPIYRTKLPIIVQGQLIRRHFAIELSSNAKLESATYIRSLQCLNKSLIRYEKQKQKDHEEDDEAVTIESKLLEATSKHLEYSGLQNPFHKVYHTFIENKEDDGIAITLLILSMLFVRDYAYQRQNNSVPVIPLKKNKNTPDFTVTTVGFLTILQQLPVSVRIEYLTLLQTVYKAKLKLACNNQELAITSKPGNELLVMNHFLKLLVQLLDTEGWTLPKVLEDASIDIDIALVA